MTTIAVSRTSTGVMFAADEQTSAGYQKGFGAEKVFQNGSAMFGVAGDWRLSNILRWVLKVPARTKDTSADEWVVCRLVPAIIKALDEHKSLEEDKGVVDVGMSIVLHAHGSTGYLDSSLSWHGSTHPFWAIGSGSEYALGAMQMGADAESAVEVAKIFDMGTGGDVSTWTVRRKT